MKSATVLEPFGLTEYFVDGLSNFHLSNGILRCAAFTDQQAPGNRTQHIANFRLIIPALGARTSMEGALAALGAPAIIRALK